MEIFRQRSRYVKGRMLKVLIFLFVIPSCYLFSIYAAADQLFTLVPGAVQQSGASGRLLEVLSAPSSAEVRLVNVNSALVTHDAKEISIPIDGNKVVSYKLYQYERSKEGYEIWSGEIETDRKKRFPSPDEVAVDSRNSAILVRDGNTVRGMFHVDGQAYSLDSLSDGRHLLVKVDVSKLPPEGKPLVPDASTEAGASVEVKDKPPETNNTAISVLFVTTNKTADFNNADAASALARANQGNANSGVAITFQGAALLRTNYNEGEDSSIMLNRIRNRNDSVLGGPIGQARDVYRGDLVVFVVSEVTDEVCGRGFFPASKDSAFSLTARNCIIGETLTHEMGHNIGVTHNWDAGDPLTNPTYVNGFRQPWQFRTIMSYDCPRERCDRVNYWSTPNKRYEGFVMGSAQYHDSVRRLNERRGVVAGFYP